MGPGATGNLSRPVGLGLKVLDSFGWKAIEIVTVTVVAIVTVRVLRIQIGIVTE